MSILSVRYSCITTSPSLRKYVFTSVFFFQAEDGIRDRDVTGVQTCALPIFSLKSSTANDESPPRSKKLSSTRTPGNCSKRCQMGVSTSIIAEVGLCFTLVLVGWHREE